MDTNDSQTDNRNSMDVDNTNNSSNEQCISDLRKQSLLLAAFPWFSTIIMTPKKFSEELGDGHYAYKFVRTMDEYETFLQRQNLHMSPLKALMREIDIDSMANLTNVAIVSRESSMLKNKERASDFCSVITAYRLMDIIFKLDQTDDSVLPPVHVRSRIGFTKTPKFVPHFKDWTATVQKFRRNVSTRHKRIIPIDPTSNIRIRQLHALFQLHTDMGADKALFNMQLVAAQISFMLHYTSENISIPDFPDSLQTFKNIALSNPSTSNADGDDAFISFLESISGDQSIDHLRFPLQVALLISPIFLLQDIQIHLSQIQRYKLAMYSKALGNDRPEVITNLERTIWRQLLEVARGLKTVEDAAKHIVDFIPDDFQDIDDATRSWFCLDPPENDNDPIHLSSNLIKAGTIPENWPLLSTLIPGNIQGAPLSLPESGKKSAQIPFGSSSTFSGPGQVVPRLKLGRRPSNNSLGSPLTDLSDMQVDNEPTTSTQSKSKFDGSDNNNDDPMDGDGLEDGSLHAGNDDNDVPVNPTAAHDSKSEKIASTDSTLAAQLTQIRIRRSPRKNQTLPLLHEDPEVDSPLPPALPVVRKRTHAKKKISILVVEDLDNNLPRLSDVALTKFHPNLYANIAGWGSTLNAGATPYRHVPVEIVRPGNRASTGDDTLTLIKVEAHIQAGFQDGLPPHLQPNASSFDYTPGSDQSRIFVSSYSKFSRMEPSVTQGILRDRLILVHGHPFDHNYGWDLPSLGRLYDVDKKVDVLVSSLFHPHKPELRHHRGTLREVHRMMTPHPNQLQYPPLNALSLPADRRNLNIPCQFGSLASHEVAESRIPSSYRTTFDVPSLRSKMEWSLVGGKGAISPFHVDSDGLATVVIVLEGSKYWIVATRVGNEESISTVSSLGPDWNPYHINDGADIDQFRFEAVHLQKGDMLIMPPGVPHWVLSTSNAICVGRHFYATSTIRLSILGVAHAFLLSGALTNEDHLETRSLLYQLLVFWSMRIDQGDVDGAHIPSLSSEEGFLDIIYLGIFVVLSPAFDRRFYSKPPPALVNEQAYAMRRFYSLIHVFSIRYVTCLAGTAVAASYVVNRILAEFAAAAVVFGRRVDRPLGEGNDASSVKITFPRFLQKIEGILEDFSPDVMAFFHKRVECHHHNFLWSGSTIQILPRTEDVSSILHVTGPRELLDLAAYPIYCQQQPDPLSQPVPPVRKRHRPEHAMDIVDDQPNKRKH